MDDSLFFDLEFVILLAFLALYLAARILQWALILRVNRENPSEGKLGYFVPKGWSRLSSEYQRLYPTSPLYKVAISLAFAALSLAVIFTLLQFWQLRIG